MVDDGCWNGLWQQRFCNLRDILQKYLALNVFFFYKLSPAQMTNPSNWLQNLLLELIKMEIKKVFKTELTTIKIYLKLAKKAKLHQPLVAQ